MNAKKCKQLRRVAREESIGKSWVDYVQPRLHTKLVQLPVPGKLETSLQPFHYSGTIRLHPMCGKAIYKQLKAQA